MIRWLFSLLLAALAPSMALAASGSWSLNNYPTIGERASATQSVPANAATTGVVLRLRSLQLSLGASGSAQPPLRVNVRDGQQGTGTILWSQTLAAPANGVASVFLDNLDIRASVGSSLSIEFGAAGIATTQQSVAGQGDMVPVGYSVGGP